MQPHSQPAYKEWPFLPGMNARGSMARLLWKQVHWTAEPSARLAHSQRFQADQEFSVPTARESFGSQVAYLPYTDELWEQLEEIENYLLLAARKLRSTGFFSPEHVSATLDLCRRLFDFFATNEEGAGDDPGQDL